MKKDQIMTLCLKTSTVAWKALSGTNREIHPSSSKTVKSFTAILQGQGCRELTGQLALPLGSLQLQMFLSFPRPPTGRLPPYRLTGSSAAFGGQILSTLDNEMDCRKRKQTLTHRWKAFRPLNHISYIQKDLLILNVFVHTSNSTYSFLMYHVNYSIPH